MQLRDKLTRRTLMIWLQVLRSRMTRKACRKISVKVEMSKVRGKMTGRKVKIPEKEKLP